MQWIASNQDNITAVGLVILAAIVAVLVALIVLGVIDLDFGGIECRPGEVDDLTGAELDCGDDGDPQDPNAI